MATTSLKLNSKLNPTQARTEHDGQVWRHVIITLRGAQSIAEVRESPELWTSIQHEMGVRVSRGDEVSLISPDGLEIADRCRVIRAQDGQVWLGKPLRMVELDPVGLFNDGQNEVWPNGTGFSIKHSRDGSVEGKVYQTQDACRVEIIRRRPTKAA